MSEVSNERKLVLKSANPTGTLDAEGKMTYEKYHTIGEVKRVTTSKGNFLAVEVASTDQDKAAKGDRYYIHNSKKPGGPRNPVKVMAMIPQGQEESQLVCGLFTAIYENGDKALKGKNRDSGVRYWIGLESDGASLAVSATLDDII